jgi:Flp pilus assembly protein TadD
MKSVIVATLALSLSGCFFVSKKPAQNSSSQSSTSEPKNHGQARKEEVHERNAERKAEKDAEKAEKKADKK